MAQPITLQALEPTPPSSTTPGTAFIRCTTGIGRATPAAQWTARDHAPAERAIAL